MITMCDSETAQSVDRKPVIHSVIDLATGRHDCCTPGGAFILRGAGFGSATEPSLDTGVYIHGSGSVLHRISRYDSWHDKEIKGFWPSAVGGPVWLFVETISPEYRTQSAVHRTPVMPVQSE